MPEQEAEAGSEPASHHFFINWRIIMPQMFDFVGGQLCQSLGIRKLENWEQTKQAAQIQVKAQLSKVKLSPASIIKWHRVGSVVGVGK
jgi:hypothetical protein